MKIYPAILIIVSFSFFGGCSNEIDLIDEVESKPVVYSLLNVYDSIYYVSLTKTFIGEESFYTLAENPENVYYKEATVTLYGMMSDSIIWSTSFKKSNKAKQPGIFPAISGHLYQTKDVLSNPRNQHLINSIDRFRLEILIPQELISAEAEIKNVQLDQISYPKYPTTIGLFNERIYNVGISMRKNSAYRQLNMRIRYTETYLSGEKANIQNEFVLRKNISDYDPIAPLPGDFFLNKLSTNIETPDTIYNRLLQDFDLILYSADKSFGTYVDTYIFTEDLSQPAWSNIKNGIGFFSLLGIDSVSGCKFDTRTKDSIAMSKATKHLMFSRWN